MNSCSVSSASASVWVTTNSIESIAPIMSSAARVWDFEKCPATRLRIELALPT